ncbi:ribosomal protein S18-alanine N-acetyltransferase [Corynebacterium lubricantis]|uniref:ribosomal protein S18-alanine N-acetyltransferase n=1 Tax=Corynebacterium lubricantis TaxID=541095 RepID=UPI000379D0CB|nr:ribosomal protein S18-alanine N-acetyltransferase [Corynebacterium lubricantis]
MKLRTLTRTDADQVAEIEALLFAEDNPWSREIFLVEFAAPHTFYVGVFDAENDDDASEPDESDVLMGYAGLAMLGPREDPEFEVHTIGVDPQFQRRGIGRFLMEQLVHVADQYDGQMFLEVRTDNEAAIKLYEQFDFEQIGLRKKYYSPSGADAYTMKRPSLSERK